MKKSKFDKKEEVETWRKILEKFGYQKLDTEDILEVMQNVKNLARVIVNFERRNKKTPLRSQGVQK